MYISIEHYPNKRFVPPYCRRAFNVDISMAVEKELKGDKLTNVNALKIFKQIKWKSDVLSILTKPIVLIPLFTTMLVGAFFIPPVGLPLLAVRMFCCAISGGLLGFSIENSIRGFLPQLSQAYKDQSIRASEYIKKLEANGDHEMTFTFEPDSSLLPFNSAMHHFV